MSCTDETNLYLAVDVTEDTPFGAIEMLPLDGEDNFKIYISTDPAADPRPHRVWHQRLPALPHRGQQLLGYRL